MAPHFRDCTRTLACPNSDLHLPGCERLIVDLKRFREERIAYYKAMPVKRKFD